MTEGIKEGIQDGLKEENMEGLEEGAAAAAAAAEPKEEEGCGLDLERSFDGRTVYLNKLEGVKAAEGGGAPAIVARPELVGRIARLEKVLLTSY